MFLKLYLLCYGNLKFKNLRIIKQLIKIFDFELWLINEKIIFFLKLTKIKIISKKDKIKFIFKKIN